MYEHHRQPVISPRKFGKRVAGHGALSAGVIALSLAAGTVGYHVCAGLEWIDAFMNASMILTGMGPADRMPSWGAKLFTSLYALYSGIVFVAAVGILLAPFLHRLLHRLHVSP